MIYANPNVRASFRDGYLIASFICDTEAELPALNYFPDYTLEIGCTAHVIENATDYEMKSDGTWCKAIQTDLNSIINTISTIEDELNDTTADATWCKTQIEDFIYPALSSLINRGAKNALNIESATTTTDNGVTFTVNADLTITITGSAIAPNNGWFIVPVVVPDGQYIFSGMPEDGGTSSYRQELRTSPRGSVIGTNTETTGNTITISSGGATIYYHIRAASGYDFGAGVTVYPMLSIPAEHAIDDTYKPYAPTNRELYKMINP